MPTLIAATPLPRVRTTPTTTTKTTIATTKTTPIATTKTTPIATVITAALKIPLHQIHHQIHLKMNHPINQREKGKREQL